MPGRVRAAFKWYLDQSPRRSLQDLITHCKENSFDVSIATLKRWSRRYEWQRHVAEHDRVLAEEAKAITYDRREQAIHLQLRLAIAALEPYEQLIDANSLGGTPARPGRSPKIKIREYLKLIEIEEKLWKLLDTMQPAEPRKSEPNLTAEEIEAMMRALTEVRHGLPKHSLRQEQTY